MCQITAPPTVFLAGPLQAPGGWLVIAGLLALVTWAVLYNSRKYLRQQPSALHQRVDERGAPGPGGYPFNECPRCLVDQPVCHLGYIALPRHRLCPAKRHLQPPTQRPQRNLGARCHRVPIRWFWCRAHMVVWIRSAPSAPACPACSAVVGQRRRVRLHLTANGAA
jgi:hypothetical protein